MIFVNSMSDLFHEEIPASFVDRVFETMRRASWHTFQVLTKRPERMRDYLRERLEPAACVYMSEWPLRNVWLGTSIENRRFVGRADRLRETPAAVRFISAEPLLGPLVESSVPTWHRGEPLDLTGIDWLIVGGESGPGHRPIREEWVRDLRDACERSCAECGGSGQVWLGSQPYGSPGEAYAPCPCGGRRTAFFFKQWGGARPKSGGRLLDGRTWDEMPRQLERAL